MYNKILIQKPPLRSRSYLSQPHNFTISPRQKQPLVTRMRRQSSLPLTQRERTHMAASATRPLLPGTLSRVSHRKADAYGSHAWPHYPPSLPGHCSLSCDSEDSARGGSRDRLEGAVSAVRVQCASNVSEVELRGEGEGGSTRRHCGSIKCEKGRRGAMCSFYYPIIFTFFLPTALRHVPPVLFKLIQPGINHYSPHHHLKAAVHVPRWRVQLRPRHIFKRLGEPGRNEATGVPAQGGGQVNETTTRTTIAVLRARRLQQHIRLARRHRGTPANKQRQSFLLIYMPHSASPYQISSCCVLHLSELAPSTHMHSSRAYVLRRDCGPLLHAPPIGCIP